MAYTLEQLANVEEAIASGTLRVELNGRLVVYQSLADLIRLRDMMKAELAVTTPVSARGRAWNPVTGSGL
jgi:predicted RNA-binding protein